VTPTSVTYVDLPNTATSATQKILGSAFDPSTRLLYVYATMAKYINNSEFTDPLIDVYYVKADLSSLSVTPPTKTTYTAGDKLDLSGIQATGVYADNTTKNVTAQVTTDPAGGAVLATPGTQSVLVSYTDNGVTKTASFDVQVVAPKLSSNSSLASLSVDAGGLSPGFDPAVTSYTVNVANTVTYANVSAIPADSGATGTGTGAHALSVGPNQISVAVTAADGTTTTYTVTVIRAAAVTAAVPGIVISTGGSVFAGPTAVGLAGLAVLLLALGVGLGVVGVRTGRVR